jgi:hypothetical protein
VKNGENGGVVHAKSSVKVYRRSESMMVRTIGFHRLRSRI